MAEAGQDISRATYKDLAVQTFMAIPYVAGSYATVAAYLDGLVEAGIAGVCFIFPDYENDLQKVVDHVLPLRKYLGQRLVVFLKKQPLSPAQGGRATAPGGGKCWRQWRATSMPRQNQTRSKPAHIVEEADQPDGACRPADQPVVEADRHQLGLLRALRVEQVEAVLQVGEEIVGVAETRCSRRSDCRSSRSE